jgi:hypothetical protein
MCVLYWHKWLLFLTLPFSSLSLLPEKYRNVESTSDDTIPYFLNSFIETFAEIYLFIPNRTHLLRFLSTSTETFVEIYTQSRSKRIQIIRFRYTYINIFAAFRFSLVLIYIPPYSVKDTINVLRK